MLFWLSNGWNIKYLLALLGDPLYDNSNSVRGTITSGEILPKVVEIPSFR